MIIDGKRYELASFGEPYSDGSRRATLRLKQPKGSVEFNLTAVKRWTKNRINNYGRDSTLNALQEQIKLWENWKQNPVTPNESTAKE